MFEDAIDLIVVTTGEDGTQGPRGERGEAGEAATIVVGETLTSVAGSSATVTNLGNPNRAVLQFNIPRGATGDTGRDGQRGPVGETGRTGDAASVEIGNVTFAQDSEESGSIVNVGDQNNAVLDFFLPRGLQGVRGNNGPQGVPGSEATIEIGEVTTVSFGTSARVVNRGTTENSILDFWIPSGVNGPQGKPGPVGIESTVEIGKVLEGDTPQVVNVGTLTNSILDFTLPIGPQGEQGEQGSQGVEGVQGDTGEQGVQGPQGVAGVQGDIGPQGEQGPQGVGGIQGPAGPAAPIFVYEQNTASSSWSITHNLGHLPSVSIYTNGELVEADVSATTTTANISFPSAILGTAVLN